MEKERTITLEDLSRRHPDATPEFDKLEVQQVPPEPPSSPPKGGVSVKLLKLGRDTAIGIAATILVLWIGYYIPMLLP
jgi:hypothetical protein